MAKVFRRVVKGKELPNFYYDVWHQGHHYQKCAGTGNRRKALEARRKFVEHLKAEAHNRELEAHTRELDAAKAGCKDDPTALVYCTGCARPLNRFLAVFRTGGAFFCSKECHEKWQDAREIGETPTLSGFRDRFLQSIQTRCRPAAVRFYEGRYRSPLQFTPLDVRLDRIDESLVESFILHRRAVISLAGVNAELRVLRQILRAAVTWKVLDRCPQIKLLRGERGRTFVLSYDDEARFLAAAPPLLRDFTILSLDCGVRVDEGLSLEFSDVHANENYMYIRHSKSRQRNLPLTERVRAMLETRRAASKSTYVFTGWDGIRRASATTLSRQHITTRAALGLSREYVCHSNRHTFATRAGANGASAATLMRLLGDRSLAMVQVYCHGDVEQDILAIQRLDAANRSKLPSSTQTATDDLSNTSALVLTRQINPLKS
jgi:integrase